MLSDDCNEVRREIPPLEEVPTKEISCWIFAIFFKKDGKDVKSLALSDAGKAWVCPAKKTVPLTLFAPIYENLLYSVLRGWVLELARNEITLPEIEVVGGRGQCQVDDDPSYNIDTSEWPHPVCIDLEIMQEVDKLLYASPEEQETRFRELMTGVESSECTSC
jgi:hypothetical protein